MPRIAAHPGQSGLHALPDGRDALAARLALADAAQRSLDVQYFIWSKDLAGKVLLDRLFRAADRGVRVRLLLDDLGTMPSDTILLTIDSHPNIEVRMFNPVAMRSLRVLGMVADFGRINKRMHNKSFIADGQVAIVGGRNIGDEYFEAHDEGELCRSRRGGHRAGGAAKFPTTSTFTGTIRLRFRLPRFRDKTRRPRSSPRSGRRSSRITRPRSIPPMRIPCATASLPGNSRIDAVSYFWGRATIVNDHPDKVLTSAAKTETHLAPKLREVVDATKRELFLVSPYFVPGKHGVDLAGERAPARSARGRDHQFAGFHGRRAGPLELPALPQGIARGRRRTLRNQADRGRRNAGGGRVASRMAARADRAGRACTRRRSPSTAGSVSSAPTISIRARAS